MNGFWGADTDALRTMGTVLVRRANALAELEGVLATRIDSLEWVGEDAERFRADWSRLVSAGLLDQEVELRHRARRLTQHADEQDEVSAPDGPSIGGAWASPGEFLQDALQKVQDLLGDLRPGSGPLPGQDGSPAELLRELLETPEGRAAFLGALLGAARGGLLADVLLRAIALGALLETVLNALSLGAALGALLGAAPQGGEAAASIGAETGGGDAETAGSGTDDGGQSASASEPGTGGAASGGGAGTGSGGGSGGAAGGAASDSGGETGADAEGAAETAGARGGGSPGLRATADGPGLSSGSGTIGRLGPTAQEEPGTLLERLLEMLGDMLGPSPAGTSSIGADIGTAHLDGARR